MSPGICIVIYLYTSRFFRNVVKCKTLGSVDRVRSAVIQDADEEGNCPTLLLLSEKSFLVLDIRGLD